MENKIARLPSYWAAVSGGKDSLFMLKYILGNLDKYPLNGVVHYELEIDYPFIRSVIDYMESECKRVGIPFIRLKPRKSWEELYEKYGFPTRVCRWCNREYKMDCAKQLEEWLNSAGHYGVTYIGYCVDEKKRYNKRLRIRERERWPLVEAGIEERFILEWAKLQPIFNHYYETNTRAGCMYCPLSSKINLAYLYKYYPENYKYMVEKMRETERNLSKKLGRPFSVTSSNPKYNADYLDNIIRTKWIKKLNELEAQNRN